VTTDDTDSGMAREARYVYGARRLGALVPRVTRLAFRRRAPATAQVLADWPAIVGPAIAGVAAPRRFIAGTLTIACAGPVAMELQYLGGELIARINTHLGSQVVKGLRFVQTTDLDAPAPSQRIRPDPVDQAEAEAAVAGLPEGELRAALAALGGAVLARARSSTDRRHKQ
jgi:hypothetical protein